MHMQYERRRHMKRAGLWAFGLGMLCIVGILTVKPGYPVPKKCSVATLKGTYLAAGITYNVVPGTPTVVAHIAVAARAIYNGDGISTTLARPTVNGVGFPDAAATGTYTVDADGTGTDTYIEPNKWEGDQSLTSVWPVANEDNVVGVDAGGMRAVWVREGKR